MIKLTRSRNYKVERVDKITKKKLVEFIEWTSSRYNTNRKGEVVDAAREALGSSMEVELIFSCGVYSESSDCVGTDYLVTNSSICKGLLIDNDTAFEIREELVLRKKQTLSEALNTLLNM